MNSLMNRVFRWSISRIPKMTDETLMELLHAANELADAVDTELVARHHQKRKVAMKEGPEPAPAWCGDAAPHEAHMFPLGGGEEWCGGRRG